MSTSLKKNFVYKSVLTISAYLINFVTFPYVSRVLGVENIGLVNFVDNTVNYFLLFATMGVNVLGVREVAMANGDLVKLNNVFSRILGLNLLFTIATLTIYLLCILFIPRLTQYDELLYVGAIKIIFTAFLVEWFFTGIENFRYITIRAIIVKLLYVVAVFVLVQTPDDYYIYFVLTVATVVLNAIINILYVRHFIHLIFREIFSFIYVKQNVVLGIYTIMTSMYLTFNVMFLGLVSNNIEVGYYTTAFKLYSVILGLFTAFTNVMLPRMSSLLADGNKERFQELINKSFSVVCTLCIPLILCSIVLAPDIIYVLSGPGYEGAILPMRIIMPAVLFVGIAQVLAIQILMPMKRDKVLLVASLLGALISLIINIILVNKLQSIGTAIVLVCSEMIVTVLYVFYAKWNNLVKIHVNFIMKNILSALPCVLLCVVCKYFMENSFFIVSIAFVMSLLCWLGLQILLKTDIGIYCYKRVLIKK